MSNKLETNILTLTSKNDLQPSSHFQAVLDEIPEHLQKAETYLKDYRDDPSGFVQSIDEDEFKVFNNELSDLVSFSIDVQDSLKDLRKFFNDQRDDIEGQFKKKLEENGFDKIKEAHNDVKQLKRDMQSQRKYDRWEELRSVFEKTLQHYERIERLAPELTDFSQLQLRHPNMVSGAKTKDVKQADKTHLAELIQNWDKALKMIEDNLWGLNHNYLQQLIMQFKEDPEALNIYDVGLKLKDKQDEEKKQKEEQDRLRKEKEEALKKEQERLAELARQQKELQEKAKQAEGNRQKELEDSLAQTSKAVQEAKLSAWEEQQALDKWYDEEIPKGFKKSFANTVEYLFNHDDYKDLAVSDKAKAGAIYSIAMQLKQQNSAVQRDIQGDPSEFLKLVRFILDV